jgi:hypothetical protein
MTEIANLDLEQVTGAGSTGRGWPMFGKIGWYEKYKREGGEWFKQVIPPSGKPRAWHKFTPSWPEDVYP